MSDSSYNTQLYSRLYGNYSWQEGLESVLEDDGLMTFFVWASVIFGVLGVFTTSLLFKAIRNDKKLSGQLSFQLVSLLCALDFGNSLLGMFVFVQVLISETVISYESCQVQSVLYPVFALTNFATLGTIALDRYMAIVKTRPMKSKTAFKIVGSVTFIFLSVGIAVALSDGKFGFNEVKGNGACYVASGLGITEHDVITVIYDIFFLVVTSVMILCYASIYFHMKKVFGNSNSGDDRKTRATERKILKQFVIITAFFVTCWALLAVTWFLSPFVRIYNKYFDGYTGMTCHLNSMANPLLYGVLNAKLRKAMLDVLPTKVSKLLVAVGTWLATKAEDKNRSLRKSLGMSVKEKASRQEAARLAAASVAPIETEVTLQTEFSSAESDKD